MLPHDSRSWHYGYRASGASWDSSDLSEFFSANPQLTASQKKRAIWISRKLEVGAPLPHTPGAWVILRKINQFCIDTGRPEILSPPPLSGTAAGLNPSPFIFDFSRWCGTLNAASTTRLIVRSAEKAFDQLGWRIPNDLDFVNSMSRGRLSALRSFGFYLRREKSLDSVLCDIPMKRPKKNTLAAAPIDTTWRTDEEVSVIMRAASEAARGCWWVGAEDEIQTGAIRMAKSRSPLPDHQRLVAIFRWRAMRNSKRNTTPIDERYEIEGQAPKGRGRILPNQISRVMVREALDLTQRLPHEQRTAIILSALGFTHGESAILVDASVTAVCRRIANARVKLREWMKWNTRDYSKIQDNSLSF